MLQNLNIIIDLWVQPTRLISEYDTKNTQTKKHARPIVLRDLGLW